MAVYGKAIKLNPDNGMSHYNLACLLALEDKDQAPHPVHTPLALSGGLTLAPGLPLALRQKS